MLIAQRSAETLAAEIESLVARDELSAAARVMASARWTAMQSRRLSRLDALIRWLGGDATAGLGILSRLASKGDAESALWLEVARQYVEDLGRAPAAAEFSTQVQVARLRRSPYLDFPLEVHIETATVCNAACSFCPYPKLERRGHRMSDALVDKLLADLEGIPRELPFSLCPFKVSDPFVEKRIFDICARINRRLPHARLRLFTNGSALTADAIERTARMEGLQHLWISLNEVDPDAYERIMGLPLARTLDCLDRLHAAVAAGDFPHPVIVSRVRDRGRGDAAFADFVQRRYPGFAPLLIPHAAWAGQIDSPEPAIAPLSACTRWFELSIMSTGQVALCCMDGEGRHVIGDAATEHALAIYNRPEYRALRERTAIRRDAGSPCDTCAA